MDKFLCEAVGVEGRHIEGYPVKLFDDKWYLLNECAGIEAWGEEEDMVSGSWFTEVNPATIKLKGRL